MREIDIRKTQFSTADFLSWQKDGTLNLRPVFQRRSVWKPGAKSYFIDTVARGLPAPIIYLRQRIDLDSQKTTREIVDGQQRLRTIFSYISPGVLHDYDPAHDMFEVSRLHNADIAGRPFEKLSDHHRNRILEYEFSTHVLPSSIEDRDVLEMFARLNATGEKLNAQELRNAGYFGEFKTLMYELAREQLDNWTNWAVFTDNQVARMKEVELTSDHTANEGQGPPLQQLADGGLFRGKTVGIDAKTLEGNAALRSIVRRDTGEDYTAFVTEPVPNLEELLEGRGVKTFALPLDTVDGLAARGRRPGLPSVPVVVVNAEDWGERQRFTIAHELGHIVLDVSRGLDAERVAHRFAGAFLIPAEALRLEVGKRRSALALGGLLALKRVFGVSIQALPHRCRDLDIIGAATYRALFNDFGRLGWRSPPYEEYGAMAGEHPNRFGRLCLRALAEGAISEWKAAELLGIGVADVNDYMRGVLPSSAAVS